jgi:hypothetical protein
MKAPPLRGSFLVATAPTVRMVLRLTRAGRARRLPSSTPRRPPRQLLSRPRMALLGLHIYILGAWWPRHTNSRFTWPRLSTCCMISPGCIPRTGFNRPATYYLPNAMDRLGCRSNHGSHSVKPPAPCWAKALSTRRKPWLTGTYLAMGGSPRGAMRQALLSLDSFPHLRYDTNRRLSP